MLRKSFDSVSLFMFVVVSSGWLLFECSVGKLMFSMMVLGCCICSGWVSWYLLGVSSRCLLVVSWVLILLVVLFGLVM